MHKSKYMPLADTIYVVAFCHNLLQPYAQCGPASGVPNATCTAIGRPRGVPGIYKCSPARYAAGEFADCEVGDLSGKDGPLVIDGDGNASRESAFPDPLAALNAQYVDAAVSAPFDKWGSIVFHNGSPRVLCAKIFKREQRLCQVEFVLFNADTDEPVGPLKAQETIMPNKFSIVARPNADCDPTRSAKLNLAGPIRVKNRVDRREPATVFGDKRGNILGRDYKPGNYTVSAEFYSMGNLRGELVVSGEFEFEIIPKLADAFGTWYIDETPNYEQTCDNVCSENGNLVCNAETAHALVDTVEKLTYVYEVELGLTPQMGYGASFPNDPISDLNPRVDYFNQQITFSSVPEDGQSICNGLFENTQQRICCCGPTAGMVCRVAPP
jgi:hypothetical protein